MRRKRVPLFAEVVIDRAALAMAKWLKKQVKLREEVMRGAYAHGGGVAGKVIFHDPAAIR
jgi:hypothetical protein